MEQLRIRDNTAIRKECFFNIPNVTKKIADVSLHQLKNEGIFMFSGMLQKMEDLSGEQMVLQSKREDYCTSNVMGFIGLGNERLVIESRFAEGEDFFLTYLLAKVLDFPNLVDLRTNYNQDNQLLEYLLFLFPVLLKSAMRKGIYKTYVCNRYNDANVRGAIDVTRHISKNIPFLGNVAYRQREYSFDNELIELIRHTIEFICQKPYGRQILSKVKEEVKLVMAATPSYRVADRRKIIDYNRKNVVRHAYYHEYRDLQHLCILILQHEKHQINMGVKQIYGILFDGAWLWEEYVYSLIMDGFYHPMNKAGSGAQRLFAENIGLI